MHRRRHIDDERKPNACLVRIGLSAVLEKLLPGALVGDVQRPAILTKEVLLCHADVAVARADLHPKRGSSGGHILSFGACWCELSSPRKRFPAPSTSGTWAALVSSVESVAACWR